MTDKKECRVCGIEKEIDEFAKNSKNKDGHDNRCKQCRHKSYENNKDEVIAKVKDNYLKNRDHILKQKQSVYASRRNNINERRRKAWAEKPSIKSNNYEYRRELKTQCFEKLGNKCVGCGTTDQSVLCIDHKYNNGQSERASGISNIRIQRKVLEGSDEYQLLCFNCNLKKSITREDRQELTGELRQCQICAKDFDSGLLKMRYNDYPNGLWYGCQKCFRDKLVTLKLNALLLVGPAICANCGIDDIDVLTFDHKNEDGNKTRGMDGAGESLYRNLIRGITDPSRFQILCLNCNVKKHFEKRGVIKSLLIANNFSSQIEVTNTKNNDKQLESGPPIEFELQDVSVELSPDIASAVVFLNNYHYAGFGRYGSIIIKAIVNSELIAILKFASPIRVQVATSARADFSHTLELDRLCVHPSYHKKNLVSFLLSKAIKIIKQERPEVTHLMSFADPEHGHDGTVYKAANWTEFPSHFRSYEYTDSEGKVHHKKTVYNLAHNRNMKESEYVALTGLKRRYTVKKYKFVYVL